MSSRTDVEGAFAAQNAIIATLQRVNIDLGANPDGAGLNNAITQCQQAAAALQKVALRLQITEVKAEINVDQALRDSLVAQLNALP